MGQLALWKIKTYSIRYWSDERILISTPSTCLELIYIYSINNETPLLKDGGQIMALIQGSYINFLAYTFLRLLLLL